MRRLLAIWLVLVATFWVGRIAVSLSLFYSLDLTFRAFVELIVVPGLQAAVLTWAIRRPGGAALLAPWRRALAVPAWRAILVLDLAVLAAAWLAALFGAGPPALRFTGAFGLPLAALAAKLAAAAGLLAVAGWRRTAGAPARLATLALAAALAVLAAEPATGWLAGGPLRLFAEQPPLVRWVRFYLPALLILVLLLLAAQAALARSSPAAARAVDWALAAVLVLAAIVGGASFLHPQLRGPWLSAAWTAGSAAATALLVAGALAVRDAAETAA
jgi:hypothetical protein